MADANLQPRRAFGAAALAKWRAAFSRSADYGDQTLFRSATFRWLWRIYCHRLTSAGRWFLWPSIIFTMYGGVSLRLQGYLVWSYIFGLWAAALLAMWLLRPRVRLTAWQAGRICAGEVLPVDIELEQTGRSAPTTIHVIPHRLAHALLPEPAEGVTVGPLRRGQRRRLRLGLRCLRRGVYTLNGYRVETDQPFGLLHASRRFESRQQLMVYPAFQRLTRLELPTGRRYHPGGVALASSIGESFEYIGNREYRDGDNLRDIDWRATARLCRPIVREYRDEYFLRVAIILDTHIPRRSSQSARDGFERAVSITAAVADFMARQEYLVDLFAVGVFNRYGQALAAWTLLPSPRLQSTGISLSPRLGESADVVPSTVRVLRLHYRGGPLYLRGLAFDTYDRGAWGATFGDRNLRPVAVEMGRPPVADVPLTPLRIEHLNSDVPILYVPLETLSVLRPPVIQLQWDASHGRSLFYNLDDGGGLVAELLVGPPGAQGPLCPPPDTQQHSRLLQLPETLHPTIRQLAGELRRDHPVETARAVAAYLTANHGYSLIIRPGEGDALADFLINRRSAHCQYFATAATVLLRCNGVPARYVNGFYAHENEGDGVYIVRQRDAHAWVEFWVDGTGWLTLDATPESGRPDQAFEPVGVVLRIGEWFSDLPDRIVAWIKRQGWPQVALAAVVAAIAAAAISAWRLLLRRRRGGAPIRTIDYGFPSEELEQLARRFERLLRKWGAACALNRTWQEHLSDDARPAMPRAVARHAASLRQFLMDYNRVRFGHHNAPEAVRRLQEMLQRLERGHRSEENA